jgi:hypothetical protein
MRLATKPRIHVRIGKIDSSPAPEACIGFRRRGTLDLVREEVIVPYERPHAAIAVATHGAKHLVSAHPGPSTRPGRPSAIVAATSAAGHERNREREPGRRSDSKSLHVESSQMVQLSGSVPPVVSNVYFSFGFRVIVHVFSAHESEERGASEHGSSFHGGLRRRTVVARRTPCHAQAGSDRASP